MQLLARIRTQNPFVFVLGLILLIVITFAPSPSLLFSSSVEVNMMGPGKGSKFCQSETCDAVLKSGAKVCTECSHVQVPKRQKTGSSTTNATGPSFGLTMPVSPVRGRVAAAVTQASSGRQQPQAAARNVNVSSVPQVSRGPPENFESHDMDQGWEDHFSAPAPPIAEDFIAFCRIDLNSNIKAIAESLRGVQSYAVCGYSFNEGDGSLIFHVGIRFSCKSIIRDQFLEIENLYYFLAQSQ